MGRVKQRHWRRVHLMCWQVMQLTSSPVPQQRQSELRSILVGRMCRRDFSMMYIVIPSGSLMPKV